MDASTRLMVDSFIRYTAVPCALGLGAMAAIVLPGSGDHLSLTRLLVGCSMLILFPAVTVFALLRRDGRGPS
ncbi:hypothetical protein [Streptomyces microflavus]|uniref:hypothetical protein n=1 Tax=Streptomyces microflavus TaxID=1919 RepID=UPI003B223F0E